MLSGKHRIKQLEKQQDLIHKTIELYNAAEKSN